ncbi:Major Facilitator Superfamily protein [Ralstonia sp. 25mfcol4.1]|uniref:MFS transporter n=1 Tax=Burkholderiaceae TaxID=119060 RepID=UPI0008895C92|nr:MFS transporter [Ralstonia sp. 25mfcol4.1]SDP16926.1 Major Facilitator Superfamily protein [Ralstonia sp. 25mfcol4.1]
MHALILCSVQCLLALTWTLYVAFLPELAAQAGLPRSQVAWILMMDQVIFVITDLALGVMADRVADAMRRLGGWVLAVSVVSALAFVMMPRAASPVWLVALTALWAATSSALRAPPMVLIARRLHGSVASFLVACSLLGVGLAGAIGPVLTARLRDASPTLPFIAASTALVIAVMALRWIEPAAASDSSGTADPSPASGHRPRSTHTWLLFAAFGLLALGFQIHTAVNSTPAYLRYVSPAKLVQVAPAFWIGFALCVLVPELAALRRHPARLVLLVAAACGALALFGVAAAGSLQALLVAQCVAGGLWGVLFGAMLRAALDAGHVGHEGAFTGLVFAVAAVAAFVRIATVYSGASKATPLASWLPWMPAVAWSMAALLLAALVLASAAPGRWHTRSLAKP